MNKELKQLFTTPQELLFLHCVSEPSINNFDVTIQLDKMPLSKEINFNDLFFFPLFGSIFCLNRLGFTDALQD